MAPRKRSTSKTSSSSSSTERYINQKFIYVVFGIIYLCTFTVFDIGNTLSNLDHGHEVVHVQKPEAAVKHIHQNVEKRDVFMWRILTSQYEHEIWKKHFRKIFFTYNITVTNI